MMRRLLLIVLAVVAAAAVGSMGASGATGSDASAAPDVANALSATPFQTVVSLTFDDGLASQVGAASALAAHGLHGTFYVNSSTINTSGFLTLPELTAIAAGGNEIGGHSTYHYDIPDQDTLDEQRREICGDRNWLLANGFSPVSYAYPYSHWSSDTEAIVAQCGYSSARQGWMFDSTTCQSAGTACAETIPPADPMAIRTGEQVMTTMTPADLEQQVTAAEATGGGWVPIQLHNVCSACGDYAITTADFNTFLDWLVAQGSQGVSVQTVAQVMGNPAVPGPGPYPVAPTPNPQNMLQNPGLEDVGPGWILPYQVPVRCWQEWGDWSVPATWTSTSDAHSGSYAMNISLSGTDTYGYHAMVPTLDLGACAPSVTPGQVLTFSGWYKSNTAVNAFQLVRGAAKVWRVLAGALTLPPAASWTHFTYTLPAMPSDATGVAPGFQFTNQGSFTVDDLSLTAGAVAPTSTLTVTPAGSGTGTVASSPAAITCGTTCSAQFAQGSVVTLTATPAAGSTFTGWSGACTGTGTCAVTMGAGAAAVTATFGLAAPAAPSSLAAVASSSSGISLAWTDNASNETGFTLQRSTTSTFTTVTSFALAANTTSYVDSGLAASTTYYYRVQATNATGSSAFSNTASAKTQAPALPAAPSALVAVAGSSSAISLTWTDNASNETGFTLQRSTSSSFRSVTSFTLAANTTSYSDSGLAASTTYYYRVQATNATGSSAYSNTASAKTQAPSVPAAPSGLAAVAGSSTAISLTWTDNASNETGFTLQRSTTSTFTTVTSFTLAANTTSYSDSGLAASTTYYYRVKATNATGSSAYSNTASATTQAAAAVPAAPSGLAAVAGSSSAIALTWTDNASNETGFTLQRSTTSTFTTVTSFALAANTTSYSDSGLAASTAYYYRVQASNATGSSAFSNTASATTQAAAAVPAAPSALAAVASSSSAIVLTWTDNASNETGFTLQRSTTSTFTTVTSFALAANTTSYSDSGLAASTAYYYRVQASNATGSSAFSNTASATTQALTAPGYAPAVLADNPISYWRLGEASGITAADQKSLNPGTYYNGVTLNVASLLGQDTSNTACTFDGVNDFINVYNSASLGLTTAVTLEAWIKPTSLPAAGSVRAIVSKLGSYSLQLDGPLLEFGLTQNGTTHTLQSASGAIQAGGRYHVVATYDGTTERLYINGAQVTSAALTGAISTSGNSLTIGSGGAASYFAGTIDEVAVYGTALSATRIASHYSAGA